jgi:type III secretion protein J
MTVRFAIAALVLFAMGCNVTVAAGLDEQDANRIALVLEGSNIDAQKEPDPQTEGKFRIAVAKDDVPQALAAMRAEELPRPKPPGVLDAMDKGALVPSQAAEHAQLVAGTAGDLERTLLSIDGVLGAHVHLNLPERDPLRDAPPAKATASVLLEHRGATPPLAPEAVQRLIAGGVSGLAAGDVAVVMVARPSAPQTKGAELAHVGPIAVGKGSAKMLQALLGGLVLLITILTIVTLVLYSRLARARAEAAAAAGGK